MSDPVVQAKVAYNAVGLTLGAVPTVGNTLIAIGFSYATAIGVNTGAGWTEIVAAAHNASISDPYIRVAWKTVPGSPSATQTPFTPVAGAMGLALFEVAGLTMTGDYETATTAVNGIVGTTITCTRTTDLPATLELFAAMVENGSTDSGLGTFTGTGWTVDDSQHGVANAYGQSIGAAHGVFVSGQSASITFTVPDGGADGVSSIMLSFTTAVPLTTAKTGVTTESVASSATFALPTGTASANYPVTNLADVTRPSKVARLTPATGALAITAVLAADSPIQFIGLLNHTITSGNIQVRVYSDAAMTNTMYDSGVLAVWPGTRAAQYRAVRPLILPAEYTARAVRIDLTSLSGAVDIGGVEIARFWQWAGISPGAEVGFTAPGADADLVGGGADPSPSLRARTYNGQIDFMALTESEIKALDWHKNNAIAKPVVFVEDYLDPNSWSRRCFQARNIELPALVGAVYRHDTFQFRLKEWWR